MAARIVVSRPGPIRVFAGAIDRRPRSAAAARGAAAQWLSRTAPDSIVEPTIGRRIITRDITRDITRETPP
ncbi:MAG: hypothetical protein HZC37_04085 [Burkholderiales bacterium]|nr:hypothetical protein [Burkholderiales bacterium]